MQLTDEQRRTIRAILSVFETGSPHGRADALAILPDGAGISYGMHQATRASGSLAAVVAEYVERGGPLSSGLAPYLPRLRRRDPALDRDAALKSLLRRAGTDPVMRDAQEDVFDRLYFEPALRKAEQIGLETALGAAVVYDGFIQGSFARFADPLGGDADEGEAEWLRRYLTRRRKWLAEHPKEILRRTVYRPDTLLALLKAGNFDLTLPVVAHGHRITAADVAPPPESEPPAPDDSAADGTSAAPLEPVLEAQGTPVPADPPPPPTTSTVNVETAGTVVTTGPPAENATAPTTPGGGPDDPARKVTAGSSSWIRGAAAWIATAAGAAWSAGSQYVANLFSLTPEVQLVLIKIGVITVIAFGVTWMILKAVAEWQVRKIHADPSLQNTK